MLSLHLAFMLVANAYYFQRVGYKTGGRESFALIREYNSGI